VIKTQGVSLAAGLKCHTRISLSSWHLGLRATHGRCFPGSWEVVWGHRASRFLFQVASLPSRVEVICCYSLWGFLRSFQVISSILPWIDALFWGWLPWVKDTVLPLVSWRILLLWNFGSYLLMVTFFLFSFFEVLHTHTHTHTHTHRGRCFSQILFTLTNSHWFIHLTKIYWGPTVFWVPSLYW
jgi:hypothetical protein